MRTRDAILISVCFVAGCHSQPVPKPVPAVRVEVVTKGTTSASGAVYSAVVPLLNMVLKRLGVGYQPVPFLHAYLSSDQKQSAWQDIAKSTRGLLDAVNSAGVAQLIEELQAKHIPGGPASGP